MAETNVGHVPSGGTATTFLKGNGSWAVPDKGSTGIRRVLTSGTDGIARSEEWWYYYFFYRLKCF